MSDVVCIVLFTDSPSASIQRVRLLIEEELMSMEDPPIHGHKSISWRDSSNCCDASVGVGQ